MTTRGRRRPEARAEAVLRYRLRWARLHLWKRQIELLLLRAAAFVLGGASMAATEAPKLPLAAGGEAQPTSYRSHKVVHAVEIEGVSAREDGSAELALADGFAPFQADAKMCARYLPVKGDFLVIYEDGYKSISPRQPFKEGYLVLRLNGFPKH